MYEINIEIVPTIPNLRPILERVLSYLNTKKDITTKELYDLISLDPVLSAKLLKLANSSIFGFPYRIDNIEKALYVIGLNNVKCLIYSLLSEPVKGLNGLWLHTLTTSVYVKTLLDFVDCDTQPHTLYTIALIHDIGKIMLTSIFPNSYLQTINNHKSILQSIEIEEEYFYFNHSYLGGVVCEKWNLPDIVVKLVSNHHTPHTCKGFVKECAILHVADILSLTRCGDLYKIEKKLLPINELARSILNLTEEKINDIQKKAEPEIQKLETLISED